MMVSEVSGFAITGYFDTKAPPVVAGSIVGVIYWYEGLVGWVQLPVTPPTVPFGTAFHLAPQWLNQSAEPISGHIELTITKPDGTSVTLNDVLNQNNWVAPGNGWGVQFEPVTLDKPGTYKATATLSAMGQVLDQRTFDVAVVGYPTLRTGGIEILKIDGKGFSEVSGAEAILSEPTVVPNLRPSTVSMTWKNISLPKYNPDSYTRFWFRYQYEATFPVSGPYADAPQCIIHVSLPETPGGTYTSKFSPWYGGAWKPGIYDAYFMGGLVQWDEYYGGTNWRFWIRNMVYCTGTGSWGD